MDAPIWQGMERAPAYPDDPGPVYLGYKEVGGKSPPTARAMSSPLDRALEPGKGCQDAAAETPHRLHLAQQAGLQALAQLLKRDLE